VAEDAAGLKSLGIPCDLSLPSSVPRGVRGALVRRRGVLVRLAPCGTAKVASMKRSIVPPSCITNCPMWTSSVASSPTMLYAQQHFVGHPEHELHEAVWKP